MKKRGAIDLTIILIILVVSAIVIGFSIGKIIDFMSAKSDIERCKLSVESRANAKQITGMDLFAIQIKCPPTNPIIIKEKSGYEDDAKMEISDAMYDCWYKFGEGKLDFLDEDDFGSGDSKCYLCSSIVFGDELKGKTLSGLDKYLIDNGYASYLWGKDYDSSTLSIYNSIPMNKPVYIMFVASKNRDLVKNLKSAPWFFGGACALGFVVGAGPWGCAAGGVVASSMYTYFARTEYVAYLSLSNSDSVNQFCQSGASVNLDNLINAQPDLKKDANEPNPSNPYPIFGS